MKYIRTKGTETNKRKILKYVRTTDGNIVETKKEEGELVFTNHGYIPVSMVVSSSYYIEELCDVFVLYSEDIERAKMFFRYLDENQAIHWFDPVFENIVHMNENIKLKDSSVYGAIWTDKGLIYVAKMNKEGELELL